MRRRLPARIVCGGQTGADRAALAWAVRNGLPHGGWCPKGRLAEDGTIPKRYHLRETPTAIYEQRTLFNVRDSDGTAIFTISPLMAGGTRKAADFCSRMDKPWIHLVGCALTPHEAALKLVRFVQTHNIETLHVAGPRKSEVPAIGRFVSAVLTAAFGEREPKRRTQSGPVPSESADTSPESTPAREVGSTPASRTPPPFRRRRALASRRKEIPS